MAKNKLANSAALAKSWRVQFIGCWGSAWSQHALGNVMWELYA